MNKKEGASQIIKVLRDKGFEALWAGGCVRDHLLGIEPEDYDIATSAKPEEVQKLFPRTIPVGAQFGVMIVMLEGIQFEVATFRADSEYEDGRHPKEVRFCSSEEDAKRRDFTINGMFFDPVEEKVIDYVKGQEDLAQKTVRAIGEPELRFNEDKLRLLRAVRFSARLGYPIEEKTFEAIKKLAPQINQVSAERIRDEIVKMLTSKNPGKALDLLRDTGLLHEVLPEVETMIGVEQPPEYHPEGDVYVHTRMLLELLEDSPSEVLAVSALLHDVGKPPTYEEADRIRFNAHEHVGARMAEKICKRLKFSNEKTDQIVECVQNHMKFKDAPNMRESKLKRFLARDTFDTELELHRIDCLASHGILDLHKFCQDKIKEFKEAKVEIKPKPLVTGKELIELGSKPGPHFKNILDELYDLQLEHQINSTEEGLIRAKERLACQDKGEKNVSESCFKRKPNRPLCIGHRGASALAPENTLASLVRAVQIGVDMIEFDVRLTRDGIPVLFHDEGLERTTDSWGDLIETDLSEVQQLDAGKWFAPSFKGEKVLTLQETFHYLKDKVLMYVELKAQRNRNPEIVKQVVALIQENDLYEHVCVVSFDFEILQLMREADPKIRLGVNFISSERVLKQLDEVPDFVDVLCPRVSVLEDEFFEHVKGRKPIFTWVSDKPDVLKKWGEHESIQAIATNNPETFFSVFSK